eukprot:jgi/Mesvir1/14470/Mv26236-RA.1
MARDVLTAQAVARHLYMMLPAPHPPHAFFPCTSIIQYAKTDALLPFSPYRSASPAVMSPSTLPHVTVRYTETDD